MKEIIVRKSAIALVDDEDFEFLNKYKWYTSNGYAINEQRSKMHRLIIKPLPNQLIDHKDHNKLNNQKNNLRVATRYQNIHNQYKRVNTTNNYKGTNFVKRLGLWQARCRMYKEDHFLGYFRNEIAAAYAYNKKASELSDFTLLNKLNFSTEELENMLITERATPPVAEFQSGVKGIRWNCGKKKWEVVIGRKYFGSYKEMSVAKEILQRSTWNV